MAQYGNQRHIPISTTSINSNEYTEASYDLILLNDILEHQRHPDKFLNRVYQLLKPDGHVYVQLPGMRHLSDNSYPDILRDLQLAHTFYWDLKLLEYLFNKTGFNKISGTEQIRAIFQKSNEQTKPTVVSVRGYYQDISQFLINTEQKRFKLFWKNNQQLITTRPIKFIRKVASFTKNSY